MNKGVKKGREHPRKDEPHPASVVVAKLGNVTLGIWTQNVDAGRIINRVVNIILVPSAFITQMSPLR